MDPQTLRRCVLTPSPDHPLPIFLDTIGYNPVQEPIVRKHGYPLYHWIQTASGEGTIEFEGKMLSLPPCSGVLLMPGVAHSYRMKGDHWSTYYVTFGGTAAQGILSSLQMEESSLFKWEPDTPFANTIPEILDQVESKEDVFGLDASSNVYRLLLTLRKYGQMHNKAALSRNLERLRPMLLWFDQHLDNPNIGSLEMSSVLGISYSRINVLFRETFRMSPYSYLVSQRLRKAKDLLISSRDTTIGSIAGQVGFRDVSHFIATFRKAVGMTPEQFRSLH